MFKWLRALNHAVWLSVLCLLSLCGAHQSSFCIYTYYIYIDMYAQNGTSMFTHEILVVICSWRLSDSVIIFLSNILLSESFMNDHIIWDRARLSNKPWPAFSFNISFQCVNKTTAPANIDPIRNDITGLEELLWFLQIEAIRHLSSVPETKLEMEKKRTVGHSQRSAASVSMLWFFEMSVSSCVFLLLEEGFTNAVTSRLEANQMPVAVKTCPGFSFLKRK